VTSESTLRHKIE